MPRRYVLDTKILTALIKQEAQVQGQSVNVLAHQADLVFPTGVGVNRTTEFIVVCTLIKGEWLICNEPLSIRFGGVDLHIDLGAEKIIAAELC